MSEQGKPKMSELLTAAAEGADKAYWESTSEGVSGPALIMREVFKALAELYRLRGE